MNINILNKKIQIEYIFLFVIVVFGTLLRLMAQTHLLVISPDGVQYIKHATMVSEGIGSFERRGPLFQALLIIIFKISNVSLQSSVFLPLFFGSVLPIIFFFVGKHCFDSKTGLVAAFISSINPLSINLSCWVLRETFSLFLILTFILNVHYTFKLNSKKKSLISTILSAFLCGLIILTREEMILVIPSAYILYVFFNEKKHRDFLVRIFVFLIATILTISPWLIYSNIHFGKPFYSYLWYTEKTTGYISTQIQSGASGRLITSLVFDFFLGLWKTLYFHPQIFSILVLIFLGIGIMYTIKKRSIWIIYFIPLFDILILSITFTSANLSVAPYILHNTNRIPSSAVLPLIIISAYGIRRFISFLSLSRARGQEKVTANFSNQTDAKLSVLIISGILILCIIEFVPLYSLTLKYFDERSIFPFSESAKFLNSTESEEGVFTMHPEILAKYYNGTIYKLPEKGGFEQILEEARIKGVGYLIVESTCVSSNELINLYQHSVYKSWPKIPNEFVLVTYGEKYGIYYLRTQALFKAAIFSTSIWKADAPWEMILTTMGASTRNFDETSSPLDIDLSEFDLIVFADFLRPLNDTERLYLEETIERGLTVIVSGLSPSYLAGGTRDINSISNWFGGTVFSEAPKEERWKVKFNDSAIEIIDIDLEYEYEFYTIDDWSTPTGCVVQPETVVYAYRVNDGAGTIFLNRFGEGTSIFIGPRYGFNSPDKELFEAFLQSLIKFLLEEV